MIAHTFHHRSDQHIILLNFMSFSFMMLYLKVLHLIVTGQKEGRKSGDWKLSFPD